MTERIKKLREQSLNAIPVISPERAVLLTEFYHSGSNRGLSVPVERAMAFNYILLNKHICINEGELIVGERGPAPKATPTYPEICLHSLNDLEILNRREKVSFKVDEETMEIYSDQIIPFWKGRTIREKIFSNMDRKWLDAYSAGIFTEFQEQRAPGHTVCGDKIYLKGMEDIKTDIRRKMDMLDFYNDPGAYNKLEQLKAMEIAADTIIMFAKRYCDRLFDLAEKETDLQRKQELKHMSDICMRVPALAPETFHEALQYYWFIHLGVITELNPWDSFNPGRLDRHLYPFYNRDIEKGILTPEKAKELLQCFWIKFNNHPAPPKIGVTAKESNTYTDFTLINTGGLNEDGTDAVNELSYMILDVIEEMRLLQPGSMVQLSSKNPDDFLKRALKIVKTGFGQPSVFNTDAIIRELVNQGKDITDARNGGASGCVESGAFGKESYILTGYFNLAKILEITMHNGVDPQTGNEIGVRTGDVTKFKDYKNFLKAFEKQVKYFADVKIKGNNIIEQIYAGFLPVPFLSLIIDDCIDNAKDYNAGGAKYNTSYIQGVGLGSSTDILTSVKYNVFDKKRIDFRKMIRMTGSDFRDFENERKELVYNTPKYGNDDNYADEQAETIFRIFYDAVVGKPNTKGGVHRINLLPTTCHVYFGSVTGAMPDGRKAGRPFSEGISPVQGADTKGPTAVLRSAAKIDHLLTGGTLLNMKFSPSFFETDEGITKLIALIRGYFRMYGHHIQFNVVTAETLRKAQEKPEEYRDLIVRVAGYSDYFNDLGRELQDEIITRTEHGAVTC